MIKSKKRKTICINNCHAKFENIYYYYCSIHIHEQTLSQIIYLIKSKYGNRLNVGSHWLRFFFRKFFTMEVIEIKLNNKSSRKCKYWSVWSSNVSGICKIYFHNFVSGSVNINVFFNNYGTTFTSSNSSSWNSCNTKQEIFSSLCYSFKINLSYSLIFRYQYIILLSEKWQIRDKQHSYSTNALNS